MKILKKLLPLIGVGLFVFFVSKLDFGRIYQVVLEADLKLILIAELFLVPILLLKSLRWHILNKRIPLKMPFLQTLRAYAIGLGFGFFTPGRAGEFLKAKYLVDFDKSIGFTRPLTSTFLDRVFDLVFLVFVGGGGLLFFSVGDFQLDNYFLYFIGGSLLAILGLGALAYFLGWADKIVKIAKDIFNYLKSFSLHEFVLACALTLLAFVAYYWQCVLLSGAVSIDVEWEIIIGVVSIAALITLLPISINGVGTRDATFLFFLMPFAVSPEQSILFSVLVLLSAFLMAAFCFLLSLLLSER